MEPDGVAPAFEHDAFHVVVEKDLRRAPQHGERLDVAADEVGERGAEVEAHEGVPGVAQHHDERHQGAFGAPDGELAEVRPVDLALLARQGAKSQIRFARAMGAQLRDAVAEVVGSAGVAPCLDHVEQPSGGQGREPLQRLGDERHVGVKLRGPSPALTLALYACLAQRPLDGVVVDAELGGDGAHPPAPDEVIAQNLRPELVADRHRAVRSAPCAGANSSTNRRAPPVKTHELADRACAEVALNLGSAARCASLLGGRLGGHRRARLAPESSLAYEWSTASRRCGTVMRHFFSADLVVTSASVAALALGMTVPAASRLLISTPRRAQ